MRPRKSRKVGSASMLYWSITLWRTSEGQAHSGMFETNLHDDRFLPSQGAGAKSPWKLELPKDYRVFDYDTLSEVVLHIRYTARQGVDPAKVKKAVADLFREANQANLALPFSLRHDFPTDWAAFVSGTGDFTATIGKDYPVYGHEFRRSEPVLSPV